MQLFIKIVLISLTLWGFSHKAEATKQPLYDNTLCYAQAAYHEARSIDTIAMRLVQSVVYNRVKMKGYPSNACGVVWQRAQFSWTMRPGHRMGQAPEAVAPADGARLREALSMARSLRAGDWRPSISADHFLMPEALPRRHNGTLRFPAWAQCPAAHPDRCMSYNGQKLLAPDFTYRGMWLYTIR